MTKSMTRTASLSFPSFFDNEQEEEDEEEEDTEEDDGVEDEEKYDEEDLPVFDT